MTLSVAHAPSLTERTEPACDDLTAAALRVRERVLRLCATPDGAHAGGSLSEVEILLTLYRRVLRVLPERPDDPDRDIFVLSKGHGAAGLYAVLAECGFLTDEALASYGTPGSSFLAHPTTVVPGVEAATGSLGHGLPLGVGFAQAARLTGSARRCVVLTGDGELQEGSVWEAAMAAGSLGLDALTAVVDRNELQISGGTESVVRLEPLADRWRSFGWTVREADGHDIDALTEVLSAPAEGGRPTAVIAHTRKGRGVPAIEGQTKSHFAKLTPRAHARAVRSLHDTGEEA
ncbi:transketolase [Streptomyces massasporeus]